MTTEKENQLDSSDIEPDYKYNSTLVAKFINYIMEEGKKTLAESMIYEAFDIISDRTNKKGIKVLEQAVDNVKPSLEVKARRVGGATFQVPMEVDPPRQISLALRWISEAAKSKADKPMPVRIANELIDAYNDQGSAVNKKENIHQMAKANRAFAHYRW